MSTRTRTTCTPGSSKGPHTPPLRAQRSLPRPAPNGPTKATHHTDRVPLPDQHRPHTPAHRRGTSHGHEPTKGPLDGPRKTHHPPGGGRLHVLLVFSGPGEAEHSLLRLLRARGTRVTAIDTKIGGASHDVLGPLGTTLQRRILTREFDAVFLAPPCSSFSVRHPGGLRSHAQPDGVLPVAPEWANYLAKHNALAALSALLFTACHLVRVPVAAENPADRGDPSSPAYWEEHADHGSLWRTKAWQAAALNTAASPLTFAQCAFGSPAQKWTTVLASEIMLPSVSRLGSGEFSCTCTQSHREQLTGRDCWGRSRTAMAAAYPPNLDLLLADALTEAARRCRDARTSRTSTQPATSGQPPPLEDGIAARGPSLGPVAVASCELARSAPIGFSSPRSLTMAAAIELRAEALPGDLHLPVTSTKPSSGGGKVLRRKRLFDTDGPPTSIDCWLPEAPAPPKGAPTGPIAIQDLFLEDVYNDQIMTWLALADAAAAAISRGQKPPPVPTRTVLQDQLQPWAQGRIWDCADHLNCKPVERSTRHTKFPGKRQINRAAFREVARLLDWHDDDLLDQIGEGGVEVRSSCEPAIVLAFHHDSLLTALPMAEESLAKHIEEGWVSPPTRHLPFVPIRLQPRGVVLQSRVRIAADGSVEEYDKPRMTTDASFGGKDSVNAGVADLDRGICLPSVQQLGRGWAICDTAFPKANTPGSSAYCVDAESAYSFLCVQAADLWMQGFVWWGPDGAHFRYDRRVGFGGAFAPNRFERTSTLCAAYTQHLQAEFDRLQPPPPCAQRWSNDRRALQRAGHLPPGEGQCHPRYLQVYIDDFTGAAGNDPVTPPAEVAHIVLDPDGMQKLGCTPAPPQSRAMVHAQLCILALERLGLHAAPQKTMCGCPLIALGMRLDAQRGVIDCPPVKRTSVLHDIATQLTMAKATRGIVHAKVRRLVGRLCNLSQVNPALRPVLHGGYALCVTEWHGSSRGREAPVTTTLAERGRALTDWSNLLTTAEVLLTANAGVALAPRLHAPQRDAPGSVTCVTDASGIHGFGGYAFVASRPGEIFVTSEYWTAEALSALTATADPAQALLRRSNRGTALPSFPMPAGELYAAILLPTMLARIARIRTCFAVGDCDPAVQTLRSSHSAHPQMRTLVDFASQAGFTWVPAQVPREANSDADRLSHPEQLDDVCRGLTEAGFLVHRLRPSQSDWDLLQRTIDLYSVTHERQRSRGTKGKRHHRSPAT